MKKSLKAWAGFVNGKIVIWPDLTLAVFLTKKEAKRFTFDEVKKVEIK